MEWLGERGCRERWGDARFVPDGCGELECDGGRRGRWFLEVDRGTERMDLLVVKARAYARLGHTAPFRSA